jgi:hypothetical protein
MQDFSSLALELRKFGYRKIYFLETECFDCGVWRLTQDAILEPPEGVCPCPQCTAMVPCSPTRSTTQLAIVRR